jgi:ABC-type cobalt transport system substrate-binding protein
MDKMLDVYTFIFLTCCIILIMCLIKNNNYNYNYNYNDDDDPETIIIEHLPKYEPTNEDILPPDYCTIDI